MASNVNSAAGGSGGVSRRSSRNSSGSVVSLPAASASATASNNQLGSFDRLSDFDLGSFTLITDDDLNFQRPDDGDVFHRDNVGQASQVQAHPQSHGRAFATGGLQLALHGRGHRLGGRPKERSRGARFAAAGSAAAQADAVKSKLQAAWNRVKYGWLAKSRASFGGNSPIVLLGNIYINHVLPASDEDREVERRNGDVVRSLPVDGDCGGRVGAATSSDLEAFYMDFESRIWLTYRRDFPRIGESGLTTDCGWGCMLRCGQMALAQGLVVHLLGRAWRKPMALPKRRRSSGGASSGGNSGRPAPQHGGSAIALLRNASAEGALNMSAEAAAVEPAQQHQAERHVDFCYRFIVSCFVDSPSAHAPFSLHRLVQLGAHFGKKAGDWYGPGSTAHIIQDAVARSSLMYPIFGDLCVYVARDCTIYRQDVIDLCRQQRRPSTSTAHRAPPSGSARTATVRSDAAGPGRGSTPSSSVTVSQEASSSGMWRSVIIFVPMRLGGERMNELYVQCLQGLLSLEHCIGIMGGRPRHSLYFVGFQDEQLIYLDPHLCQDCVDPQLAGGGGGGGNGRMDTSSYHCPTPRKLAFSDMDPSCTIGFYCRDEADFKRFLETIEPYLILPGQRSRYPLFVIDEGSVQQATAAIAPRVTAAAVSSAAAAANAAATPAVGTAVPAHCLPPDDPAKVARPSIAVGPRVL